MLIVRDHLAQLSQVRNNGVPHSLATRAVEQALGSLTATEVQVLQAYCLLRFPLWVVCRQFGWDEQGATVFLEQSLQSYLRGLEVVFHERHGYATEMPGIRLSNASTASSTTKSADGQS